MDDNQSISIKLTNHLTGEITEVEVSNTEQAKNLYLEISASESVIKKAKDMLKAYVEHQLGAYLDDPHGYKFMDGHVAKRRQNTSYIYRVDVVREVLADAIQDKDVRKATLEACMKLDQTALNDLLAEMQNRGEIPGNTLTRIRERADMKATKPFVVIT